MNKPPSLTLKQLEEFESNGYIIIPSFLPQKEVETFKQITDELQGSSTFNKNGRWDKRNCIVYHTKFIELLTCPSLLTIITQILGYNIKLLGSHLVATNASPQNEDLPVTWHRDGGVLSAELPDPLPQAFIKANFCLSGSHQSEGGELLVVPGSHRLIGEPSIDPQTQFPVGVTKVLVNPRDLLIFDWRLWHAVNKNTSKIIRRTLYLTFGFRWLSPIDFITLPEALLNLSSLHRQLLGGSTELGNYLPTEEDLPLKPFIEHFLSTTKEVQYKWTLKS